MGSMLSKTNPQEADGSEKEDLSPGQSARRKALRELSEATNTKIFKKDEDYLTLSSRGALAAAGSTALAYYVVRLIMRDQLSGFAFYKKLAAKADKTKLFELYMLSIVNAGILTAYSMAKLWAGNKDTHGSTRLLAAALGYFCHDFVAMRHEFRNDPGMFWHHVFGIGLVGGAMVSKPAVKKYVPPIAMVELSTVFLSGMWLMKELELTGTAAYKVVLGTFAATFFATRVFALPYQMMKFWNEDDFKQLGVVRYMLLGLAALNLYWAKKIVGMARKQLA